MSTKEILIIPFLGEGRLERMEEGWEWSGVNETINVIDRSRTIDCKILYYFLNGVSDVYIRL